LGLGPGPGTPSSRTERRAGRPKPAMRFIRVDLPQPWGPTIATNSPSWTARPAPWMAGSRPWPVAKPLATPSTTILLADIAPLHGLHALEQPGDAVEEQADHADDYHAGDHEVVTVAGIARVHDQVAEARAQGDHLRGDDDEPGDADADAHADDDLGQHRRDDDAAEQHAARDAEIGRRAQVAPLDRVHARGGL